MAARTPERRHLAAVFVDLPDNLSGVDASRLMELAGRSRIALYTYQLDLTRVRPPLRANPGLDGASQGGMITSGRALTRMMPTPAAFPQYAWDRLAAVEEAARRTGGAPGDFKNSALPSLRTLIEEYRRSYVLHFRPQRVADAGWHDLDVRVTRPGGEYTVRGRPGYLRAVDSEAAEIISSDESTRRESADRVRRSRPMPDEAGEPLAPDELPALFERYADGDYDAVVWRLRQAADAANTGKLIRREGPRWADHADGGAHRRAVVAALALEVAAPAYPIPRASDEHWVSWTQDALPLVYWGGEVLGESLRVHPAERSWYLAAIASLQGMLQFRGDMRNRRDSEQLRAQAVSRIPDEPRYRLAQALGAEQLFELGRVGPQEVRAGFDHAIAWGDPNVTAETQLRYVSRYLDARKASSEALGPITDPDRRAESREFLALTSSVERTTSDDFLIFISRFFRARIYDRLDERGEAEAAYRAALEIYPAAQSASVALATLLYLRGENAEAQRLVNGVLASPDAVDPWRVYHLQDYRRLPLYIEQMRAALTSSR
jgi:tetratricopeptide (TPR) repeat protein